MFTVQVNSRRVTLYPGSTRGSNISGVATIDALKRECAGAVRGGLFGSGGLFAGDVLAEY
jgi:hypothetical protein